MKLTTLEQITKIHKERYLAHQLVDERFDKKFTQIQNRCKHKDVTVMRFTGKRHCETTRTCNDCYKKLEETK
jgi:hypothetical protein